MEGKLPDQTASVDLGDVDHAGESAVHVKEALSRFVLPLHEGGLEAMTTVENFMDVWHLPANAARRPHFLSLLSGDPECRAMLLRYCDNTETNSKETSIKETNNKETSSKTNTSETGNTAHVARVSLGVLNRLAQCVQAGPLLLPQLDDVLRRTQAAPPGQTRLMWLEVAGALLRRRPSQAQQQLPTEFVAFLSACVAASSLFAERTASDEDAVCGELTGLAAAHILHGSGIDPSAMILSALEKVFFFFFFFFFFFLCLISVFSLFDLFKHLGWC